MTRQRRQTIIAGVCAAIAALAVFAYTASVRQEAATAREAAIQRYGGETAEVLVASEDIAVGTEVSAANTSVQEWLVDLLPAGEVATSLEQVEGQVAQVDLVEGEPVLVARVGNGTSRISVPEGLSAVTVSSDDVLAVGGAIKTGSFVDVYVESTEGAVELLGEQILVLETSTDDDAGTEVAWVTLAVTPSSVSELITASTQGTIHFALPSAASSASEDDDGGEDDDAAEGAGE